ncbi:MAG: SgcJ/EcaC family oxidoreductase [Acidobacteriota bacterium]
MQVSIQVPAANQAIQAIITSQTEAWNRKDASGWTRDFAEDASFVNVRGDLVRGRAAIERIHAFIFSGPYKNSPCATTIDSILFPAPGVAMVDTTNEVTGFTVLPPGLVPTAPGVFRTRMKMILVSDHGGWKILSAQNTAISPETMPVR